MSGTTYLTSEDTMITLNGIELRAAVLRSSDEGKVDIWTDPPHSLQSYANEEHRHVQSSTETMAYTEQALILAEALRIYEERNEHYKDNWRRFGWRGCLFRMRERVERAWDNLWDRPTAGAKAPPEAADDDLIDLINFACFTIRAIREGNRDGSWW